MKQLWRNFIAFFAIGFLGALGSAVGIASGLSGLFGGSSSGSSGPGGGYAGPPVYVPTGLSSADTQWQTLLGPSVDSAYNLQSTVDPIFRRALNRQLGIDTNPLIKAGQQAGQQYGNLSNMYGQVGNQALNQANQMYGQVPGVLQAGNMLFGQGQNLYNQGQAGMGYGQNVYNMGQNLYNQGQSILNTAMDPQNALYNRTQQQVQDQANATNSMYGLGSSGAGAGIANQALSNFNIDWQNQQLARQAQGMSAAMQGMGALGQGMNALGQGYNMGLEGMSAAGQGMGALSQGITSAGQANQIGGMQQQAGMGYLGQQPGATLSAAQTPIDAMTTAYGMPAQFAGAYTSNLSNAMAPGQSLMGSILPYLNYGTGATGSLANQYMNANMLGSINNASNMNALMTGIKGLSGSSTGGSVNNWLGNLFGTNTGTGNYGGGYLSPNVGAGYNPYSGTSYDTGYNLIP